MSGFWQERTKSERGMIIAMGIVVAIGVPLLVMPAGGSSKKLLSADDARKKFRVVVSDKTRLDQESDKLTPEIEKLTYNDAPDKLLPETVRVLQKCAKESGIHIREIKPLRAKNYLTVTRVPVSVRFTTDFAKSIPFIYRVEDPATKLVVEKLNISAADVRSRSVDVEVQVALFTRADAPVASGSDLTP